MSMVRNDPWNMLNQLRREMDRFYDPTRQEGESGTSAADWVPPVDVLEETNAFVIRADVPGVDPKQIEVHAENGTLTVKGERLPDAEPELSYKRRERVTGSFFRRFSLPDTADTDKIAAKCLQGVLEIRIPKHERLQPRKITVEG